jgi:hypothetical protein
MTVEVPGIHPFTLRNRFRVCDFARHFICARTKSRRKFSSGCASKGAFRTVRYSLPAPGTYQWCSMFEVFTIGLIHVAALVGVAAMVFRNQIVLRGLLILSTLLYILYYFVALPVPMWSSVFWSVVTIGVNLFVMVRLIYDRTQFRLSDDELRLFAAFRTLTPGEFRCLTGLAAWRTAGTRTILTREGAPVDKLYYVLDGAIGIAKGGRSFPIADGTFIGEVAFLRGQPASATVTLEPGARYLEWSVTALNAHFEKAPTLRTSLVGLFNADLAAKLARA